MCARGKLDELTLLQSRYDLEPDLAARLISAWYEAISWRTPFITFIVRVKNTEQLAIRRSYRPRSFRRYREFAKVISEYWPVVSRLVNKDNANNNL